MRDSGKPRRDMRFDCSREAGFAKMIRDAGFAKMRWDVVFAKMIRVTGFAKIIRNAGFLWKRSGYAGS